MANANKVTNAGAKMTFDTRSVDVLKQAMGDGLFTTRDITVAAQDVVTEKKDGQTTITGLFRSKTGASGAINFIWEDFWGPFPYSVFAYAGRDCQLKDGVSYEDLCAKCFQINQETPLSNVSFRIDEPERFKKEGHGFIVCIAGLPLLPFEMDLNYQNGIVALETLLVGAMESAFAGEQMIEAYFQDYVT